MIPLTDLLVPVFLSAVFVFIASAVFHSILRTHRNDFARIPEEGEAMESLRKFDIPPGDYIVPHCGNPKEMKSPAFVEKVTKGPVIFMTVLPNRMPGMGMSLALWFVYCVVVSIFAAYIASHAVARGAGYLTVFRYVGTVAFAGYSLALLQNSIWYKKSWAATFRSVTDGLVYALLTAGTFGWRWPG